MNPKSLTQAEMNEINNSTYSLTANAYHEATKDISMEQFIFPFLAEFENKKNPLLDLGCGSGVNAEYFERNGYHVVGIDSSKEMLDLAQKVSPGSEFIQMDMTNMSFPITFFGGIWANSSFLHVARPLVHETLANCYDLLVPKSPMFITVKYGVGDEILSDSRYGGLNKAWTYFDYGELETMLHDVGFTVLESDSCLVSSKEYAQGKSRINIFAKKY